MQDKKPTTISLSGRIDSNNAVETEERIRASLPGRGEDAVVLDAEELEYISSAGLRVILHVKKTHPDLTITNVNSSVYEILDTTGFTQIINVEKAYRVVSVEGCEEIGRGANGTIYRIDQDNVVKVYNDADALSEIQHEREVAKLALILGVPTAISYDVVRVGDSYGSVFELLNARSFSKILATEPEKMDWCVREYVEMLKIIHGTMVPEGKLPDIRETVLSWARFMQDYLPGESGLKLLSLVEAVPRDNHMIHGDYHTKNLELQNDEVLLIDMDTLAVGHPIFELGSMFNAFVGFYELDHEAIKTFQGFDFETGSRFWHKSLAAYLGTEDQNKVREVEDKARIIGYTRLIRRLIRRNGLESEEGRASIDYWKKNLIDLLERTDTLLFEMNVLEVEADTARLPEVMDFVEKQLDQIGCPMRASMQLGVAVEELFVNIAHYAYEGGSGTATIKVDELPENRGCIITLKDRGVPYNPVEKEDPDIGLSAEERQIGGLGIYLAKKNTDGMEYEHTDGFNILRLTKLF